MAVESVRVSLEGELRAVKTGSELYKAPKCIKHTVDTCKENTVMCDLPFVVIGFFFIIKCIKLQN